jgi:hypothetical protein
LIVLLCALCGPLCVSARNPDQFHMQNAYEAWHPNGL